MHLAWCLFEKKIGRVKCFILDEFLMHAGEGQSGSVRSGCYKDSRGELDLMPEAVCMGSVRSGHRDKFLHDKSVVHVHVNAGMIE